MNCQHMEACSGCAWISRPYEQQREEKQNTFMHAWRDLIPEHPLPNLTFNSVAESGLRDRVDLVVDQRTGSYRLGLFSRDHLEIVDIEQCPQLSPNLQAWLGDFRKLRLEVTRGSVRLRVSPRGERGAWLDLANVDVKKLLGEETFLRTLKSQAFVEIGQKRKALIERDGRLKLGDPEAKRWFETYTWQEGQLQSVPLFCSVGSFTQPGFTANRALVGTVLASLKNLKISKAIEFGSGIGNFTLPLASLAQRVEAFELEPLACENLAQALRMANLEGKVNIYQGDFQKLSEKRKINFADTDLILVDPPRSGLKDFLTPLVNLTSARPTYFIYVSCFLQSFLVDAKKLLDLGYKCPEIALVDQFPQTPHIETVAVFI